MPRQHELEDMIMSHLDKKYMDYFFDAVLSLETREECSAFFEDVCTINELRDLTSRLEVARLLNEGKVFNDIIMLTGASSATIGRVNKCLRYGPGGYKTVLNRLDKEHKEAIE